MPKYSAVTLLCFSLVFVVHSNVAEAASGVPLMNFGTYLGGIRNDRVDTIAVDNKGNIYVAGTTESADFPTTAGSYHPQFIGAPFQCGTLGGRPILCQASDAFVIKFSPAGAVLWSTYVGGTGTEWARSIAVDGGGNVYVAGTTDSADFPLTANAGQKTAGSGFLFELDSSGSRLSYSSYLPAPASLALSGSGDLYIAGTISSPDFPALNAIQPQFRGGDCSVSSAQVTCSDTFIMRWRTLDMKLLAATFYGGSGPDSADGIALDPSGNVYVAGSTASSNFPLKNALQSAPGGGACPTASGVSIPCADAFVLKLTGDLQTVFYSTLLGGNGPDSASSLAVDGQGNVILTGSTASADFPTANAFQPHLTAGACTFPVGTPRPCTNAFAAKLNPAGSALVYSTYLGGAGEAAADSVAVDAQGTAFVVGGSVSGDYPVTPNAIQHCNLHFQFVSGGNGFLTALASDGHLSYSSFLGGTYAEDIHAVAVSGQQVYLGGFTGSHDFPVIPNAVQEVFHGGDSDGFVAGIDFGSTYTGPPRIDSGCVVNGASFLRGPVAPGEIVTIFGTGLGPAIGVEGKLDDKGMVSKSLAGVTVAFDGLAAPILWAQDAQVNAIAPFGLVGKSMNQVTVTYLGVESPKSPFQVSATAPGIFSLNSGGAGQVLAVNQDGSLNGASNPAPRGSILTMWMTGGGLLNEAYSDGQIAPLAPNSLIAAPQVLFGGATAQVQYAGQAPGFVAGATQVNVFVPMDAPTGPAVMLYMSLAGLVSQEHPTLTVALQ